MAETEYQGRPIRKHSLAVRGASGDALSGVLKVKPQAFEPGVPFYVLTECIPNGVHHNEIDGGDDGVAWELVQIGKAQRGTIIDAATALPYLDELTVQLETLRVEETGQSQLSERVALEAEHLGGRHKRVRKACPLCNPQTDEDHAKADEYASKGAEHGDGEGDAENPTPAARKRRSRAPKK